MEGYSSKDVFTLKQFCEAFGVSRSYVYLQIKADRLKVKRAGRRVLVCRQDAQDWVSDLPAHRLEVR